MSDISFDDIPQAEPAAADISFDDIGFDDLPNAAPGVIDYGKEFGKSALEGGKNLAGAALKGYGAAATGFTREQLAVMDRIDRGDAVPDIEDPVGYQHMTPEQRAQARGVQAEAAGRPMAENPLVRAGQAVEDFGKEVLGPGPGFEGQTWTRDIGGAFGSMAAGIGLSLTPAVGPALAGTVFLGGGMGEAAERAKQAGATDEQAVQAARLGAIAGSTDVVDALLPMLGSTGKALGFIRRVGMRTVYGALAEGGQEGLQQVLQNAIAKGVYDPDQDMLEDVPRNVAIGMIVGGVTAGGFAAAEGRRKEARARGRTATDAVDAPAPDEADRAMGELDALLMEEAGELPSQPPVEDTEAALAELARRDREPPPIEPEAIIPEPSIEDEEINTEPRPEAPAPPEGAARIEYLPPGALHVDAQRFQYKGGADQEGVTGALKDVKKWDDRLANPILAWEANDGRLYVVNGHQRTDLAKRAQAAGQPNVHIPARIMREADGYSPEFMRALGAFQNIAEGTGTAVDAAKVLRANQPSLADILPPLPPRSQLVQDSKALSTLSDQAFGMVVNDLVPASYAAHVGRILKEPAEQLAAMDMLAKATPANPDQARIMVEDIRNAGFLKGEQTGLFGEEEFARSLVAERARILDRAVKTLRKLGTTFKTAVEQEGTLAAAGNKLKRAANEKARTENERLAEILATDGTRKGPISDALSAAARELADGKPIGAVTPRFLSEVRAIARGPKAGVQPGPAANSNRPAPGKAALYSVGRPGQQRPESAANLPATRTGVPAGSMTIEVGGRRYPIKSYEQASEMVEAARDQADIGGSQFPTPLIYDERGKQIAYVSYNGRVWPGRPQDWKSVISPIYDNRAAVGQIEDKRKPVESVDLAGGRKGDQFVLPGAEKAPAGKVAQRKADAPLRPAKPQKPADIGLFGDKGSQLEFDTSPAREQTSAKGSPDGSGTKVREGAPGVSGKQPARRPEAVSARRKPEPLSLFDWGGGREPVQRPDKSNEQGGKGERPAAPAKGGSVTKPPSVGGGNRPRRNPVPAEIGLEEARKKIAERSRLNYRITDSDHVGEGGPKQKVRDNLEAIRVLKQIEDEARQPTPEEKAKLVKFTGWGAFAQDVFASHKPEWRAERDALRSLLTDAEYENAKASTLNAHYTSPDVIRGMWDVLDHLGFDGGLALEPSAGIGHFIGLIPDHVAPRTAWTAVELDTITGRIAKALYGGSEVYVQGYQELKRPANFYDLAISNVPFGDYNITEKPYGRFPIHDFFFVKSLDKVRPGGVVAFITSRYTMDRMDADTRRLFAREADLIGAIRLPGGTKGAFAGNAGTQVTTDIIFLRKKVPGEKPFPQAKWLNLKEIKTPEGPVSINEYFADHPDMMMGKMRLQGSMYRDNEPVLIGSAEGLRERIAEAARKGMEAGAFLPRGMTGENNLDNSDIDPTLKDGALFFKNGKVYQRQNGQGIEQKLGADDVDRVRRLSEMRGVYNDLLAAQLGDTEKGSPADLRGKLSTAYNSFVRKWGPINLETNTVTSRVNKAGEPVVITKRPNLDAFKPDPDVWKVASIELYDPETGKAKPADIQTKDVIEKPTPRQISGPADALAASLDQYGEVDIDAIADNLGMSRDQAIEHLGELIYLDPNGRKWVQADQYLSGNVVQKLEEARAIAQEDKSYRRNVEALEKVQPAPLRSEDIVAQFGAPWVPEGVYNDFIKDVLDGSGSVRRVPITGEWRADIRSSSRDARTKFATDRVEIGKIFQAALNNQQVTVWDEERDGKRSVNHTATEEARVKTEALKEAFTGDPQLGVDGWVWRDPERTAELEAIYNRTYNNLVPAKSDGSHLTLPGLNRMFADRKHRLDAIWRMVTKGNTLLAHVVGSGKTVTMIAGGMEMKRLGLINKPAYVVPNHMLEQFSREFLQAYPNAKIIVAQKDEMTRENRKAFLARVASNDWDGVIITHDAFGRINMARQFREQFVRDQLADLERVLRAERKETDDRSPTVKGLEKAKKRLQDKLSKLLNEDRKDEGVTFEESGIDFLFVDEAHKFKNLAFVTRLQRVKGLAQGESQRAEDLFLKIRYLDQKRPGRSAVFATGTPVSNTMAELWTMQRYLQLDKLRERDLDTFDAWASTFGRVVNNMELAPDGRSLKEVSSFSRFVNVPELISLYSEIADTKTADMLNLPRPEVRGPDGKPGIEIIKTQPSEEEGEFIDRLVALAESLKGKKPEKGQPNMLSVVTLGRKVATDGRLVGLPANENGKIATASRNIYQIWKDGKEPGTVQMVFLDMGVPKPKGAEKPKAAKIVQQMLDEDPDLVLVGEEADSMFEKHQVDLYADLKRRLVDMGIPAKEIAAIHDATDDQKKAKLFSRVRSGDIRILIGSSEKMGVGTNVQDRLIAMHHLDAPWKPAEVEQRDGRIVRQGNKNKQVRILRYVTEKSFDAFMWQKLDTKSKFIGQVLSGAKGLRQAEDIDNPLPEAAEMKAAASGDPRILELAELDRAVRQLASQRRVFEGSRLRARDEMTWVKSRIQQLEEVLPAAQKDAAKVEDLSGDNFKVEINGKEYADRKEAGDVIIDRLTALDARSFHTPKMVTLGKMSGFDMRVEMRARYGGDAVYVRAVPSLAGEDNYTAIDDFVINAATDPAGLMRRFENILKRVALEPANIERRLKDERASIPALEKTANAAWPKEEEFRKAQAAHEELTKAMTAPAKPKTWAAEIGVDAGQVEDLKEKIAAKLPAAEIEAHPVVARAKEYSGGLPETVTQPGYGTPEYLANREYVFPGEIVKGTEEAVERLVDVAKAYAKGPVANERRAVIVTGPPASGKSFFAEKIAADWRAALVDSDDAKKALPEFGVGLGANAVHAESGDLADDVLARVLRDGSNVVLPKVGGKVESIRELIDALNEAGYQVDLVNISVKPDEAYRRMISRFVKSGRLIGKAYFDGVGDKPDRNYYILKGERKVHESTSIDGNGPIGGHIIVDGEGSRVATLLGPDGGRGEGDRRTSPGDQVGEGSPRGEGAADAAPGPDVKPTDVFDARRDLTPRAKKSRKDLEIRLTAIVRRMAGSHVKVAFQDAIPLPDSALKAWGSVTKGLYTAAGRYLPAERLIDVAMADPRYQRQESTAYHEGWHAVENLLLNDREMNVLRDADAELRAIAADFAGLTQEQASELADYEARAIAFEAYADKRDQNQKVGLLSGAVRNIFERLRQMLRRVRNALNGMGYQTAEDVFAAAFEGRMAGREAVERPFDAAANVGQQPTNAQRQATVRRMDMRPIDRALRIPFDVFGGTDQKGQWKPGLKLSEKAAKIITDAKFSDQGRFHWINPTLERARAGLIDRYGLDPAYVERDRERGLDERRIMAGVTDIMRTFKENDLTPAEAILLQKMLTGEPIDDARLATLAGPIRQAVDQFGQEAVDLGLLSPESFERNRGAYLHRVYQKHETDQNALVRWVNQFARTRRKKIIGNQFKGRGLWKEVSARTLDDPQKGDTVVRNGQTWEVRGFKGPKVVLWRDYTPEERERMGEILDARYTIAKTYMVMAHDLATGRFYRDIAASHDWSTPIEPARGTWKNAAEYNRFWNDPEIEWVRVPDTKIASSNTRRYGALAGQWVRAEIWRDINELEKMQSPGWWNALTTQWKLNKALALDTPIPTPSGWTTMGEIRAGDKVFDETGAVCEVLEVKDIQHGRPCFDVVFSDGEKITADDEHFWFTEMRNKGGAVRTTKEIRETLLEPTRGDRNHSVPVAGPLNLPLVDLPVAPYAIGLWLGDGNRNAPRITAGSNVVEQIEANLAAVGMHCGSRVTDKRSNAIALTIDTQPIRKGSAPNTFKAALGAMGLLGNKHIPPAYLRASIGQRQSLLNGLMDSDGWITEKGTCGFATSHVPLRDGVIELLRSLGYKPTTREIVSASGKPAWRIHFQAYADEPVSLLAEKASRLRARPASRQRSGSRQIIAIEPVPSVPVRCIAVSSKSHLYLAGRGMIPTHNTARSPVTHMNNVMSNVLLMDMADVRARDLVRGIRALAKNDALYKEAADAGAFGGDMISQEIRDNVLKPLIEEIAGQQNAQSPVRLVDKVLTGIFSKGALAGAAYGAVGGFAVAGPVGAVVGAGAGATVGSLARKPVEAFDQKMLNAYRLEDEVFRMATYIRRREQGLTPKEAAIDANEQFLNYDIRAPWVNAARRTVLPFIAYTYRATPLIAKTVMTRPWKIAKYATAAFALNALGYALFPGDEDEERRSMRKEEQGKTWLGVPRMMRMPWGDADGNPVFLDVRRWIPSGDIFDVNQGQGALPVPAPLQFGGPLMLGAELALNKQAFTGKPIVNTKTDDMWDQVRKVGDWAWKSWMPSAAWIPGSWYWEKIGDAAAGARDRSGRPYSLPAAVSSSVGIKLKAQDKTQGLALHKMEFDRVNRDLDMQRRQLARDRARNLISAERFNRDMESIARKKTRAAEEMRKALGN